MKTSYPRPGIYLVTDPAMSVKTHAAQGTIKHERAWHTLAIDLTAQLVEEAVKAGVETVQLRWKNVDSGYFLALTEVISGITAHQADLIINDRIDVYLAARERGLAVDGVHIGQTDLAPELVRQLLGDEGQLGWSASLPDEVARANQLTEVITSVGVGVLRSTATKTDAPPALGFQGIADIAQQSALPVTAIGGIGPNDIEKLAPSVHNIAVVSALVTAENPYAVASDLVRRFNTAVSTTAEKI